MNLNIKHETPSSDSRIETYERSYMIPDVSIHVYIALRPRLRIEPSGASDIYV
jgi:hypothetical protein